MSEKFDVIIVGAGPAGSAAAYITAKAGLNTIIVERGDHPGAKNVMGGILYSKPTGEIIPEFWKEAPLERHIVEQNLWVLDKNSAVKLGYRTEAHNEEPYNAFSVFRSRFDRWFAKQAVEKGALLITETAVEDLIFNDKCVVGVKTGRPDGEIYGNVVILAEGVNSMLAQKIGLQKDGLNTAQLAVAVKEVIGLDKGKIDDRFNLEEGQGASIETVGESTLGMMGTGFIYTNTDTVSVGVGALLSQLVRREINPNELLELFKKHPVIKPLIEKGETKEYLAHLIPEGGYNAIPKLYADGVVVVGDAAQLVNGIHREGSNMAMISGKIAAETVITAHKLGEYDERALSQYQKKLADTFILKDLKKYQHSANFFEKNDHIFSMYPYLANKAAEEFLTVDNTPKKDKQRKILHDITSKRSKLGIIKDIYRGWRVMG